MLSPHSASVATEIFASVPAWREFAREEVLESGETTLVIEVPAPEGSNALGGLMIRVANNEIVVSFDHYRAHFDRWSLREPGFELEAASFFAFAIASDSVRVASAWDGERWCGSCFLHVEEEPDLASAPGATRMRIRSWSGRYDDDRAL